jgi:hypothetical protein
MNDDFWDGLEKLKTMARTKATAGLFDSVTRKQRQQQGQEQRQELARRR